ncbi:adenylate/guanylate cyclase domain-containing protein [Rhizobium giardinii]|uniref:adenylate/guanylate cyclase domain-containing protein n=1 Tax=Rhizobium giardinii TaxID=56731 RepID=UPI003D6F1D13
MVRKLATIFAADIVEYSRYMEENEESALHQMANLRETMDAVLVRRSGRIANTAGDSVIAIFESPVEAVLAAVEIQAAHKQYNEAVPREQRLVYRMGINIGDVTVQPNGDVLGAGVNIAARLESIAQPGGICLSENVYEHVNHKLPTELKRVGEHFVKNLAKPIIVYAVGDPNNRMLGQALRRFTSVTKRPLFHIVLALSTVAVLSASLLILLRFQKPDWAVRADGPVQPIYKGRDKQDILADFDLVTEGRFRSSQYFVIRTWGGSIDNLVELSEALGGHLAYITSAEENDFLFRLTTKEVGHWVVHEADNGPQSVGPMIGLVQTEGSPEPDGGWQWLDGSPLVFNAWARNSPGNSRGNQNLAQFRANGTSPQPTWDDIDRPVDSSIIEIENQGQL